MIKESQDALDTLASAMEALESGMEVVAYTERGGRNEHRLRIVALEPLDSRGKPAAFTCHFEGPVIGADRDARTVTLADGAIVRVAAETDFRESSEGQSLLSLDALAKALGQGREVMAYGGGELQLEPKAVAAIEVTFVVAH